MSSALVQTDDLLFQLRDLALILGLSLVVVVGMGLYIVRRYRSPSSATRPHYPETRRFSGRGTTTLEAPELIAAQYRLDYAFPDAVLVKIELVEVATGSSELILLKSGSGVEGFVVETTGRYLFEVEPPDETADWSFSIKPVGLMANRDL
jgi:hypothetical protein